MPRKPIIKSGYMNGHALLMASSKCVLSMIDRSMWVSKDMWKWACTPHGQSLSTTCIERTCGYEEPVFLYSSYISVYRRVKQSTIGETCPRSQVKVSTDSTQQPCAPKVRSS